MVGIRPTILAIGAWWMDGREGGALCIGPSRRSSHCSNVKGLPQLFFLETILTIFLETELRIFRRANEPSRRETIRPSHRAVEPTSPAIPAGPSRPRSLCPAVILGRWPSGTAQNKPSAHHIVLLSSQPLQRSNDGPFARLLFGSTAGPHRAE